MCGIFLAAGDLAKKQDDYIYDMFIMDSLRGPHSCGVMAINNYSGNVHTFKRAVLPHDFLDMKGFSAPMSMKNKAVVGHNRWATQGAINSVNAHPFTIGDITGVHNGTLKGQWRLPDHKDFDVDSQNIIHSINKIGIEETWKKIDGAAALIWWDEKEQTLNFIRNKERPLYFCYSTDLRQMYAASEHFMMQAALHRNGIEYNQIEDLPVDTLYSFKIDTKAANPKDVVKCTTKKLNPLVLPKKETYVHGSVVNINGVKRGDPVDFFIYKERLTQYSAIYDCIDNVTSAEYYLEVWDGTPYDVGECLTGTVKRVAYDGTIELNPYSIRDDSRFEYIADEEQEEESEDGNLPALLDSTCDWCGEELGDDYLLTSDNQKFCGGCKDLNDVQEFINIEGEVV